MSLIDSIKKHEGFSPVVYKCIAGYDTIGYGKRIKYLKVTEEQSLEWLKEDLDHLHYVLADKYEWFLPAEEEVKEVLAEQGVDFNTLATEYAENGELSEATRAELEKVGFSKDVVDSYIAGQEALAAQLTSSVYEQVGGEAQFTSMTEWAGENLSPSEVEAFNDAMDSGNMGQVNLAVSGLQAKYVSAVGKEGARLETRTSSTTGDRYESLAQLTSAMSDPRYATDPAYRNQVAAKLDRSPDF